MSRLIDADAMIAKCGDWYTEEGTEEGFIGTIRALVDEQPTIEPERKKGEWISWLEVIESESCTDYIPHCKCSVCGKEYDPHYAKFVNFCHVCGSEMKGEDRE